MAYVLCLEVLESSGIIVGKETINAGIVAITYI